MPLIKGRINFHPRPHQSAVMLSKKRHRASVMHRRAGKTVMAIFDGLETLLSCPKPMPHVGYVAPFLKQAKRLAWDYLVRTVAPAPRFFDINASELTVNFKPNGGKFVLAGGDNVDALRGDYWDKIILDELADMDPSLWPTIIRPALADRQGRALAMGTPRGRMNLLYDLSQIRDDDPEWDYFCFDCTQTNCLPESEIDAMRREMPEAVFQQELMCSFNAALLGSVYGKEMNRLQNERRFTDIKYDEALPVITAWDLGFKDATAILYLQRAGNQIWCIEYEEHTLTKLPDIIKTVLGKPYVYSQHFGPHDIAVREYGSGRSRIEIARENGIDFEPVPAWPLEDQIEAVQAILPHLWIDRTLAKRLLEVLINYQFEYDDRNRSFRTRPRHDWTSHGCSALAQFAIAFDPGSLSVKPKRGERQRWLI